MFPLTRKPRCALFPTSPRERGEVILIADFGHGGPKPVRYKVARGGSGRSRLICSIVGQLPQHDYCTPSSSTSKIRVALGGMTPPAPRAP
jgi:hypothetical protein